MLPQVDPTMMLPRPPQSTPTEDLASKQQPAGATDEERAHQDEPGDDAPVDDEQAENWFISEEAPDDGEPGTGPVVAIPLEVELTEEASDGDGDLGLGEPTNWALQASEEEQPPDETHELLPPSTWLETPFREQASADKEDRGEDVGGDLGSFALELPPIESEAEEGLDLAAGIVSGARSFDPCFREVFADDLPATAIVFIEQRSLVAGNGLRWIEADLATSDVLGSAESCGRLFDMTALDPHSVLLSGYSGRLFHFDVGSSEWRPAYSESASSFEHPMSLLSVASGLLATDNHGKCWRLDTTVQELTLEGISVVGAARGAPACALVLRNDGTLASDDLASNQRVLLPAAPRLSHANPPQLVVDQSVQALLIPGHGVWASEATQVPARPFPGFVHAQAACAGQLDGRAVIWLAEAGEDGGTDIVELDLADGRVSVVANVTFRETDEVESSVSRMVWDAARQLLWLCSDAGLRALQR